MKLQLTWEFADERSLESGPPQLHQNILAFGGFAHVSQKKKHLNTKTLTNININFTLFTILLFIFLADWRVHI